MHDLASQKMDNDGKGGSDIRGQVLVTRPAQEDKDPTSITYREINTLQRDSSEKDQAIRDLIKEYQDVFQDLPPQRKVAHQVQHRIPTKPGCIPDYPKSCYQLPADQLKELKRQLGTLVEKGFILPSNSPIAAPVFFVKKRDGALRIVVDYWALNAITIKTEYPLPRISALLDRLGSAKLFSTLDLQAGYHQGAVHPEDQ